MLAITSRRSALCLLGAAAVTPLVPAVAASAVISGGDVALEEFSAELEALGRRQKAMIRAFPESDPCDDIPGYAATESRYLELIDLLFETDSRTMAGVSAKSRALLLCSRAGDWQATGELGRSVAEDVMRLHAENGRGCPDYRVGEVVS